MQNFGALVISLDFEIHWGVRDKRHPDGSYRQNLLGVQKAIPHMLDLFEEFGCGGTLTTLDLTDENIASLKKILEAFARFRESHGMRSLTMADVADRKGESLGGSR